MKKIIILILLSTFFIKQELYAQVITQYELVPLHLNPANAGNFNGDVRVSTLHYDRWRSVLGADAYQNTSLAVDSRIKLSKSSYLGAGITGGLSVAGAVNFRDDKIAITGSFNQHFRKTENSHHAFGVGLDLGRGFRQLTASVVGGLRTTNYMDLGTGAYYQYVSKSRFNVQIAYAIFHFNRPNVSFSQAGDAELDPISHIYAFVELPIKNYSIIPRYFSFVEGDWSSNQVRVDNRFYFKNSNYSNWIQVGPFGKFTTLPNQEYPLHNLGVLAQLKIAGFTVGFSFDRHRELLSNTYEFSLAYIFGAESQDP